MTISNQACMTVAIIQRGIVHQSGGWWVVVGAKWEVATHVGMEFNGSWVKRGEVAVEFVGPVVASVKCTSGQIVRVVGECTRVVGGGGWKMESGNN